MTRAVSPLAAAILLSRAAAADQPEPVALFSAACLDTLPAFSRAAEVFVAAGWAEDFGVRDLVPGRAFGSTMDGQGMVETEITAALGPAATCAVFAGPSVRVEDAVERIDAAIRDLTGLENPPECFSMGPVESCTWLWQDRTGCRIVTSATADASLKSVVALSIETDTDCSEVPR